MDEIDLTSPFPANERKTRRAQQTTSLTHKREDPEAELPLRDKRVKKAPSRDTSDLKTEHEFSGKLSHAQATIVELAKRGESFFFSGCAGSGKTFTLRAIIDSLPDATTFITSTTGISASLLPRGTTLHSFAGIGHGEGPKELILKKVRTLTKVLTNWKNATTLIIDEVSMLSRDLFELVDYIAREVRHKRSVPFGGIQVICCGDFFQLPPVSRKQAYYCFESSIWQELIGSNSFQLLDIFRQKDPRLIDLLNEIFIK